jgi:hypothetical protein
MGRTPASDKWGVHYCPQPPPYVACVCVCVCVCLRLPASCTACMPYAVAYCLAAVYIYMNGILAKHIVVGSASPFVINRRPGWTEPAQVCVSREPCLRQASTKSFKAFALDFRPTLHGDRFNMPCAPAYAPYVTVEDIYLNMGRTPASDSYHLCACGIGSLNKEGREKAPCLACGSSHTLDAGKYTAMDTTQP